MKQGATTVLPVEISCGLTGVSAIKFKLRQGSSQLIINYPSTAAARVTGTNMINISLTPAQTFLFDAEEYIELDSIITLADSSVNPDTEVVRVKMLPTLFERSDLGVS